MTAFPLLFEPIRLGRAEIRNRIVLTGHGTGMGRDGKPDERMIAYYEERAKGEVGLIMLGSQQVHPTSPGITGLICNHDREIIPSLSAVARAVHRHLVGPIGEAADDPREIRFSSQTGRQCPI